MSWQSPSVPKVNNSSLVAKAEVQADGWWEASRQKQRLKTWRFQVYRHQWRLVGFPGHLWKWYSLCLFLPGLRVWAEGRSDQLSPFCQVTSISSENSWKMSERFVVEENAYNKRLIDSRKGKIFAGGQMGKNSLLNCRLAGCGDGKVGLCN